MTEPAAIGGAEPTVSTVDELAAKISAGIMSGRFPIGSWLRQDALASLFGVSRTPIREALRQVQASGLVEIHPHRGALVRGPSTRDIHESYTVRAELEGLSAKLAAVSITDEQLARLSVAEQLFQRAVDDAVSTAIGGRIDNDRGWGYANDLFHEAILTAADNRVLEQAIADIHRRVPRNLTWSALRTPDQMRQNVREHEEIRRSLVAHDGERARAAMISHVMRSGDLIATWFATRQDREPAATT